MKKNLREEFPHLEKDWDKEKNAQKFSDFGKHSKFKAWWRCHKCKYSWQSAIRNRAYRAAKCPICVKKPPYLESLAYKFPEIDNMIHPDRNYFYWAFGRISGLDLYCNSKHKIWWKCEYGHEFKREVRTQVFLSKFKCPKCKIKKTKKIKKDIIVDGYNISNQLFRGLEPEQYIELLKYQDFKCWLTGIPFEYDEKNMKFIDSRIKEKVIEIIEQDKHEIDEILMREEMVPLFAKDESLYKETKVIGYEIIKPLDADIKIAPSIDHCHDKGHIRAILNGYINTLENHWIELAYPKNLKEMDIEKIDSLLGSNEISFFEYIIYKNWDDNKSNNSNYRDVLGFEIDLLKLEKYYIESPAEKLFGKITYK